MKTRVVMPLLLVSALLAAAGCRQADGPMPEPQSDTGNRIGDMSRDLLAVARGDETATQDFADDLSGFANGPEMSSVAQRFARQIAETVKGTRLSDQAAQQLAQSSWVAVAGQELSDRQIEELQEDFRTQLTALGLQEPAVTAALTDVATVQAAVNRRPRRWYEVF